MPDTVGDRIRGLTEFLEEVRTDTRRTPEGRALIVQKLEAQMRGLSEFPDDMELLSLWGAMEWDGIDDEQKFVIRWQHRRVLADDGFWGPFMEAIDGADDENMERLAKAFPEIRGVEKWRKEPGYAAALRAMPFAFSL